MGTLKQKLKPKAKWLYYTLVTGLKGLMGPKQYRFEYKFFEEMRAATYFDLNFRESKLRSWTHQLDKTLTFKEFKEKKRMAELVTDLAHQIVKEPNHDPTLIRWCYNVLSEYKYRSEGNPPSKEAVLPNYDIEAQGILRSIIESRRSIRSFKSDPISKDVLSGILNAGLWAPTACNRQQIEYLILETKEDIRYCQKIAGEKYFFPTEAPVNVVVLIDVRNYAIPVERHMAFLEAGAAIQNMLLTAHSLGVGSCWLFWNHANQRHDEFVRRFSLKSWFLPVAMLCFGYSDNVPKFCPARKSLKKSIHYPVETQL